VLSLPPTPPTKETRRAAAHPTATVSRRGFGGSELTFGCTAACRERSSGSRRCRRSLPQSPRSERQKSQPPTQQPLPISSGDVALCRRPRLRAGLPLAGFTPAARTRAAVSLSTTTLLQIVRSGRHRGVTASGVIQQCAAAHDGKWGRGRHGRHEHRECNADLRSRRTLSRPCRTSRWLSGRRDGRADGQIRRSPRRRSPGSCELSASERDRGLERGANQRMITLGNAVM
jgi:hypothetical protein